MAIPFETHLRKAYTFFNARDIQGALALMHPDVDWPNGMEGGMLKGHDEIHAYWIRQWTVIDPRVQPESFFLNDDGSITVQVRQIVKDLEGKLLLDQEVHHTYVMEDNLIRSMEISNAGLRLTI